MVNPRYAAAESLELVVKPTILAALFALASFDVPALEADPAPTIRSKTEVAGGELICTLELVHAKRPMYVSSFEASRAQVEALGLTAPAGWSTRPDAASKNSIAFERRLDLSPGKPITLRFPLKHADGGRIKLHGMLEYGGGVEQEGEMFLFDVLYPCPAFREGPAWGEAPPADCVRPGR